MARPQPPLLYRKIATFIDNAEIKKLQRDQFREQITRTFRISSGDIPALIRELQNMGIISKKTQRTLRFK